MIGILRDDSSAAANPIFTDREIAAAAAFLGFEGRTGTPELRHLTAARAALSAADAIAPIVTPASRHLDGLDASRETWAFVEEVAGRMPPHPSREIQVFNHERGDGNTVLFWHAGHLAAVGVVARDVANWSVAATWETPKAAPGGCDTERR